MHTQGNFHAHKNKFSCARKYFFMRIEILRLAHGRETKERCLPPPYAQSVNPRDVIAGGFFRRGFIVLHAIEERVRPETLTVSYGELGLSPRTKYKREPAVEAELLQRVSFFFAERVSLSSVTIWDLRSICIVISGVRSLMIGELLVISTTIRNRRPISTTTMAIPPMRGIAFGL